MATLCVLLWVWLCIATFTGTRVPSDASKVARTRGIPLWLSLIAAAIFACIVVRKMPQKVRNL